MYKILTEIPSICFMERGIDVDELITKICKNDKVKWEMYGILMNAVCSIICGFLTDNMVLTAVYIGVTAIIDILSEIELEMEGLVNWEKIISRIFEINNWIKYLIFVVFALLPVICGVFTKEIAVSGIKDFRSVIFVNVFPNVCGSLIVCSLVAHISKLNERQFISALIKSKRSLFNIIIRGIFFACYLNAVNYNAADNWKYANYVNSIYLFFIISSGSIAVVSFLSRLVDDQPFPYTAKKVFPQWTLSFSVLFLFSCGAAPLIAKTGKHEPFLLLFNTITAIVLFGALLHFVIRKTNQVDKAYPYGEFVIFFLLVSANCAVNFFKWDRWEQTGDIGSQIVSGVLILVITIIILLYLSYRQNENLKKLQEEKNKIATDG